MNDLISRQAAIEAIVNTVSKVDDNKTLKDKYDGAAFRQHEILDIIEAMPPAQQWIPVKERLPILTNFPYDVTDDGLVVTAYLNCEHKWMDYHGNKLKNVSAWRPRPEPFKEVE